MLCTCGGSATGTSKDQAYSGWSSVETLRKIRREMGTGASPHSYLKFRILVARPPRQHLLFCWAFWPSTQTKAKPHDVPCGTKEKTTSRNRPRPPNSAKMSLLRQWTLVWYMRVPEPGQATATSKANKANHSYGGLIPPMLLLLLCL